MTKTKHFGLFALGLVFSLSAFGHKTHNEGYEGEDGDLSYVNALGEGDNWLKLISKFGGKIKSASHYPNTPDGFARYMFDTGVTEYDPIVMITPESTDIAKKCGVKFLLPAQTSWARAAAISLWATAMIPVAGEKPNIISWYREPCYNKAIGGASSSDHMSARSMDIDFSTAEPRRKAQKWLCQFWNSSLNMQVGLGDSVIHLGSQSPRGKRNWYYETYTDSDMGKTCFD